jgi:hypothetical protein
METVAWADERLSERFARIDDRFDHLERRMEDRFVEVNRRIDQLSGETTRRFDEVDRRFDKVERAVISLDDRMTALNATLHRGSIGIVVALIGVIGALLVGGG